MQNIIKFVHVVQRMLIKAFLYIHKLNYFLTTRSVLLVIENRLRLQQLEHNRMTCLLRSHFITREVEAQRNHKRAFD